ncbi:hypothetical protein QR721_13515 [Aciduricibacillus chroicocephali]|uniref:Uncharacterized protein n=1 Tax=Aciduricibacillus chroicocephali TaxID=3054939 RepID=A0ABY9KVC3_9BACI|nr:hypothetical protein QR721_13515 [Bacillaceae bacterium 44XB]
MSKSEMMDKHLDSTENTIDSAVVCEVVESTFGLDLDEAPILENVNAIEGCSSTDGKLLSRVVIDSYLNQCKEELTGPVIRGMINRIFGVNLDAISSLEGKRISLYSKGQWIVHNKKDLFVVHTGIRDVDVKIYPTTYFTEQTGLSGLPMDLQQLLMNLGYTYNKENGSYYYINPTGEAVPDQFKGKTMQAIGKVIHESFSSL